MNANEICGIIVNNDHQYSVWQAHRSLPAGWRFTGPTGPRSEMLATLRQQFVETVATPRAKPGTSRTTARPGQG